MAKKAKPASHYIKHRAPHKWNKKVILSTKGNEAVYKPGISHEEMDKEYVDATPIPYLLFKVSGGVVHARPVSKGELRRWGVKIE